jgi:hypothetical protein
MPPKRYNPHPEALFMVPPGNSLCIITPRRLKVRLLYYSYCNNNTVLSHVAALMSIEDMLRFNKKNRGLMEGRDAREGSVI